MKWMQTWRWFPAAMLLAAGVTAGRADDLRISSLEARSNLVFRTAETSCSDHHYRVECTTSLVSAAWSAVKTVGGVGAGTCVTNSVPMDTACAFYRVVATSNSNAFVDGAYMAVDISGGTDATSYAVSYYASTSAVPGGIDSDVYKTTSILMRLIPKGTFTMGARSTDYPFANDDGLHQVTLTQDFYIGVFEVTQRQWELVMGNKPSYFTNATYYASRPVDQVSYYDVRENPTNSAINPHWPQSSQVHADSFMGKLRAKTRVSTFDLPTESQWEYACRAGTSTALNSGRNLTGGPLPGEFTEPEMDPVARYWRNSGGFGNTQKNCDTSVATAKVGSYLPNAWGLHDMHGNLWEWCLDWYGAYTGTAENPVGAESGSDRVGRGGGWLAGSSSCSSACRPLGGWPIGRYHDVGFRAARTLP